MAQSLHGTVESVSYRNQDSGFSVLKVAQEHSGRRIVAVGHMANVQCGHSVTLQGEWYTHPKYGEQFTVDQFEIVKPVSAQAIATLLTSGIISNIGATRAQRLIDAFGTETLDIIENAPHRLREVEGIGKKIAARLKQDWDRQRDVRDTMLFLQQRDISTHMAARIYETYGEHTKQKLSANPYALIDDIWGIGFKKADDIAHHFGFDRTSFIRIRAGLVYVMQQAFSEGHVFVPAEELAQRASRLLQVEERHCVYTIDHLVRTDALIRQEQRLYLPVSHTAETSVARSLRDRLAMPGHRLCAQLDTSRVRGWLSRYAAEKQWHASERQNEVLYTIAQKPLALLTGGPGTGKTTALRAVVDMYHAHGASVILCAPTGRAAQHLQHVTSYQARTIHRLLKFNPHGTPPSFQKNADDPLACDIVIVDEVSMMDIFLMRALLRATALSTKILFVGDHNQLPSVGPGNVLRDMIRSRVIPHIHLDRIFRQAARSRIVTASHEIIAGRIPRFSNDASQNCFFLGCNDPGQTQQLICDLVTTRLPAGYGLDPVTDIQVITPMHKGVLGTQQINERLQAVLNASSTSLSRANRRFAEGDKVMQIRNNYRLGVFNGDIGYVHRVIEDTALHVQYPHTQVEYTRADLDELLHAYCISAHKSQGSEFRCVVLVLSTQHYLMLQRNLLYTALTRAKQLCVCVGMPKALGIAVRNNAVITRYTSLTERLTA